MVTDGSVTLNSGASKEAAILETGNSSGKMTAKSIYAGLSETGGGGNKIFDSSQVSVASGDLNQKNDV